jgi:hypothetical protein
VVSAAAEGLTAAVMIDQRARVRGAHHRWC